VVNETTNTTANTQLPTPNKLSEVHLKGHSLHPLFSLRYKIIHELGQGGHGIVFGGQRRHDGAPVAMKFVLKSSIHSSAWVSLSPKEKVPLEVYILSHCQHASIIGLVDYFEQAEYLYIVMEMHGTPWQKKTLGMSSIDAAFQALPLAPSALETQIPATLKRQAPRDLFE
jgi:hypothetical protein